MVLKILILLGGMCYLTSCSREEEIDVYGEKGRKINKTVLVGKKTPKIIITNNG